jgi:acyl carrier protein
MSYERWMAGASEIIPKMDSLNAKSATLEQFQHIKDKINGFLSEEFEVDIDQITPDANLREVLALDSLDYIDLVAAIENNFSFKVKLEDLTGIITFSDFYGYIISHVQLKESGDGI